MKIEKKNIALKRVRLSFPSLFKTEMYNGEDTGKYTATFIIPKSDTQTIDAINAEIERLKTESKLRFAPDKIALQDGDHKDYDGYADSFIIKATTKKRPHVVNKDRTPIHEDDNIIYGGCYVNASISLWVQDNGFGKRINASLNGIQFAKNGQRFGESFDVSSEFDDISDEADDGDCPF